MKLLVSSCLQDSWMIWVTRLLHGTHEALRLKFSSTGSIWPPKIETVLQGWARYVNHTFWLHPLKKQSLSLVPSITCVWPTPKKKSDGLCTFESELASYSQPGFLISVCMFRLLRYGFVYMTPYTYFGYMYTYVYTDDIYTKRNTGVHLRYRWNRDIQTYEKLTSHPSVMSQGLWRNLELVNWLDCFPPQYGITEGNCFMHGCWGSELKFAYFYSQQALYWLSQLFSAQNLHLKWQQTLGPVYTVRLECRWKGLGKPVCTNILKTSKQTNKT